MSEELRAREVLAQFCDRDGHPETARIFRSSEALNAESGGRTCIDAMLSFASSAAGQREGWKLVPDKVTDDWAHSLAEYRQGRSETPRCEPPSEYDVGVARRMIAHVLAASPSAPEERRDEVGELVYAARAALTTLQHARVFVGSRQVMHADGQSLYDADIVHLSAALAAISPVFDGGDHD